MSLLAPLDLKLDRNRRLGYVPALDGLRAVAILAVMLFHLKTKDFFPGGGVGVDLFFVLSGFLITTLLLQEWATHGSISLKSFYQRRALRLLPAVVVFVLAYLAVNIAFSGHEFTGRQSSDLLLKNIALIAAYSFNWLVALGGTAGSGLSHLWSLSVEEQFYLAWPAILLIALRLRVPLLVTLTLSMAIVVASAAVPFILEGNWSRFYYGNDFRLQGLMLGSCIGQLYAVGAISPGLTRAPLFRVLVVLAALFLAAVILEGRDGTAVLFSGGHTLVALCSAVLILGSLYAERNLFAALLSNPVLVYIGKRSYALYLWHAAINVWLQSFEFFPHFVLTVTLSFLAAETSYRLVEAPALGMKSRLDRRRKDQSTGSTTMSEPSTQPAA